MWTEGSGISTEWLRAEARTEGPILWAERHLDNLNAIQDNDFPDHLLTDEQIHQQLKLLFGKEDYPLCFTVDQESLRKEQEKIEHLKEHIEKASHQLDTIQKYTRRVSYLDSIASRELEFYKSLRTLRDSELTDLTSEFNQLSDFLNEQKNNLMDKINETAHVYLTKGQSSGNQINVSLFDEYFLASHHLISSFGLHLQDFQGNNENEKNTKSADINVLLNSNKLIENHLVNYINTKAKLNTSKEFLKFLLTHKENSYSAMGSFKYSLFQKHELENYKRDFKQSIAEFVKRQTAFLLLGELNSKLANIEFTFGEINIIASIVLSLLTCSEVILSSLKSREKYKDDIIFSFFSVLILLMTDINKINNRNEQLEQCLVKFSKNLSGLEDQIKFLKKCTYKIFLLKDDMSMKNAKNSIKSIICNIPKMEQSVIQNKNKELLLQYEKFNHRSINVKKFIWDGATSQPNVFNKDMEINLYESEKQNERDNETVKVASNKYIQLKSFFQQDTTLK